MGKSDLGRDLRRDPRRSSKPGREPRSAGVAITDLPRTEAAVGISEEAGLQVLGSDGSASHVRHRAVVSLQR